MNLLVDNPFPQNACVMNLAENPEFKANNEEASEEFVMMSEDEWVQICSIPESSSSFGQRILIKELMSEKPSMEVTKNVFASFYKLEHMNLTSIPSMHSQENIIVSPENEAQVEK